MEVKHKLKPNKRTVGGEKLKRVFYNCPICNHEFLDMAYLNGKLDHKKGKKTNFCPDCGQEMNWNN